MDGVASGPAAGRPRPTGVERRFGEEEIIVSKTDLGGRITYANDVFQRVAGYTESELIGAPHSIVRSPAMPRAVFALLWKTIQAGHEIFAYVVNLAKNGDHYWVLAHVTPTVDTGGTVIGYHSNRRRPDRGAIDCITSLYEDLVAIERQAADRREGLAAGVARLERVLASRGQAYDQFVWSLVEDRA